MKNIVGLNEKNIKDVVKLEKVCFSTPWSEKSLLSAFENGTTFAVYCEEGVTKGYMGVSFVYDEGYITNVAVFPQYRKQGVATALLDWVMDEAKKREAKFVSLEVRQSNSDAVSLYRKFGFEKTGVRPHFYINPDEDALILTRRF